MTDPAAAPVPAKEPLHVRVAGALERAFNPIMVKELRASLRGAKFFITHLTILSLFACGLLLTFAGEMSSGSGRYSDYGGDASRVGRAVYLITQLLHVAVVFLVVPGLAATSISGERERLTHELLISTTLTARQIVWGKFIAAMTQTFTIFASMVPLVGLCFLFGGITIYQIVANYAFLFALSALVVAFALNISAGARTTQRAVGSVYGLVILGSFFTLILVFNAARSGFLSEVAVAYGFISRGDDFGRSYGVGLFERVMYVHVIPGFLWASLFAFFFMNATNRLKPLFANRSTSIRAFFVVAILGAGFLTILTCYHVFPPMQEAPGGTWEVRNTDYRKVAIMVYAIGALTLSLLSALFACEDPILPPHLEAEVAGLRGVRRLLRPFWPGATSGMVFSLLFNLLFLGASFAAFVPFSIGFDWGNFQRLPSWTATALALTVVLLWTFLTAAYGRFLGITLASRPILLRTIFVLTCLFVALFPILHWAISTSLEHRRYDETPRAVDGPFTLGLSPAAAIVSLLDPSPPPHDFPSTSAGIPTVAVFLVFAAAMGTLLVFLGNRSGRRLRAELAKLEGLGGPP